MCSPVFTRSLRSKFTATISKDKVSLDSPQHRDIATRDELIDALSEAAQLEHSLLCAYLYAAATLKTDPEEFDNNHEKWETVREWKRILLKIAREEMQHLHLVNALVTAIGGPPVFKTPNFPTESFWFGNKNDDGVDPLTISLCPLNLNTLKAFIRFESSGPWIDASYLEKLRVLVRIKMDIDFEHWFKYYKPVDVSEVSDTSQAQESTPKSSNTYKSFSRFQAETGDGKSDDVALFESDDIKEELEEQYYETIGELYNAIKKAFKEIPDIITSTFKEDGTGDIDTGSGVRAIAKEFPTSVDSVGTALRIIDSIVAEGEGADLFVGNKTMAQFLAEDPDKDHTGLPSAFERQSHLYRFLKMRVQYRSLERKYGHFEPSRTAISNPCCDPHTDTWRQISTGDPQDPEKTHLITAESQAKLMKAFSITYQTMLMWLQQLYLKVGSEDERASINGLIFLAYMTQILRPFMEILSEIDAGEDFAGYTMGPTFEAANWHGLISHTPSNLQQSRLSSVEKLLGEFIKDHPGVTLQPETLTKLNKLHKNIELLHRDFEERTKYGYDSNYQDVQRFSIYPKAPVNDTYEEAGENCVFSDGLLQIDFGGWYLCRLATDPDPAADKWGASGNTFAYAGEPPFDRALRFGLTEELKNSVERSHFPDEGVGVKVRGVKVLEPKYPQRQIYVTDEEHVPQDAYVNREDMATAIENVIKNEYYVELVAKDGRLPVFEGQNHIVAPDGEPVDPFVITIRQTPLDDLEVKDDSNTLFTRSVRGPPIMDMEPGEKAYTNRFPKILTLDPAKNVEMTGITETPWRYFRNRVQALRDDLHFRDAEDSQRRWVIKRRIDDLFMALNYGGVAYDDQLLSSGVLQDIQSAISTLEISPGEDNVQALRVEVNKALEIADEWVEKIDCKSIREQLSGAASVLSSESTWDKLRTAAEEAAAKSSVFRAQQEFTDALNNVSEATRNLEIQGNDDIRTTRLKFFADQFHSISGEYSSGGALSSIIEDNPEFDGYKIRLYSKDGDGPPPDGVQGGENNRWLVQYQFGWYDTDLLASYVKGVLHVPIQILEVPQGS